MDQTTPSRLVADRAEVHDAQSDAMRRLAGEGTRGIDGLALAAVISGITGVGIALSLSLPLLSVVLSQRGVSPIWIGVNTATAGVAAISILPFVSELAKRFGTARMMITAFITMSIALMGFYLITPFVFWFPLRFIFSASVTLIFALTEFWISSLAPSHRRGLIVGIYTAFLSIGITIGPLILAIVGTHGIMPFLIGSLCLLAAAIPVATVRAREPEIPTTGGRNLLRFVLLAPLPLFAALVFGAVESGGTAILPLYGVAIGLSGEHAVILVSAIAVGNVLSQIPIGYLADRVNRRLLLIVSAAVGAVGGLLIPVFADHYVLLLLLLFITGGIVTGLYTIGLTQLASRYTGGDLASANAAFVMMYAFGMLIGPISLGGALDLFPPHGFAIAIALIFGIYVVMALLRVGLRGLRS
ncbi:MFS transporter [Acuticoccus kandeliae]|uniref:MFS transporter n=1 Tax=Acuticoccus kandeliae TaxID=2073160 RepID=UPI000D3E8DE0|nr:MFS transporter [Acuticoccus kandeliae]